jgi:hypothetical protein
MDSEVNGFGLYLRKILKISYPRIVAKNHFLVPSDQPLYYMDQIEKLDILNMPGVQLLQVFKVSCNHFGVAYPLDPPLGVCAPEPPLFP